MRQRGVAWAIARVSAWLVFFSLWRLCGAAVLEGVALEHRTGRPLARSKVSLEGIRALATSPISTLLTDSQGRFRFSSLAAGAYLVTARRDGYASAKFGQKRWNSPGTPIVLGESSEFFAEMRLKRLGTISGAVLDENQVGLAAHSVYAFRAGRQPLRLVAAGASDDRGMYRITGLEPGRYYVRTGARELEDGRTLAPTFFGQTTAAAQASLVEVDLDVEALGIDVAPLPGRLVRLSGSVTGAPSAAVTLYSDTGKRELRVEAGGQFVFDQLAPGNYYQILAESTDPPRVGYRTLWVGEAPSSVALDLGPLPALRVRCEEKSGKTFDPRQVSVFLRRNEPPESSVIRVLGNETVALSPGEYVAGAAAPMEFAIDSLRTPRGGLGTNEFIALPGQTLELTVVLSAQPASVVGQISSRDGRPLTGAPVFLHPVDPELCTRLQGSRAGRTDQNGEYRFFGLPPGKYQIFSSFELEPQEDDWGKIPAQTVTLEEGQQAKVNLEVLGGL
jgi:hypothetical protein